jgi:hypothetical protein
LLQLLVVPVQLISHWRRHFLGLDNLPNGAAGLHLVLNAFQLIDVITDVLADQRPGARFLHEPFVSVHRYGESRRYPHPQPRQLSKVGAFFAHQIVMAAIQFLKPVQPFPTHEFISFPNSGMV